MDTHSSFSQLLKPIAPFELPPVLDLGEGIHQSNILSPLVHLVVHAC